MAHAARIVTWSAEEDAGIEPSLVGSNPSGRTKPLASSTVPVRLRTRAASQALPPGYTSGHLTLTSGTRLGVYEVTAAI